MASSTGRYSWNSRMMIGVALIIIAAWSFNRFIGRSDCINSPLIEKFELVGTEKLKEFELCHKSPTYDFIIGQFGEYLIAINQQLKKVTLMAHPAQVRMNFEKPGEYSVTPDRITIGSDLIDHLSRALVEKHFFNSLPNHPSRELYIDLLTFASGHPAALPKSLFFAHYAVREEDYCKVSYLLPNDHLSCRLRQSPYYPEYLSTLLQRPGFLRIWQLFYSGLNQDEKLGFLKAIDQVDSFPELPVLDFETMDELMISYQSIFETAAEAILPEDLKARFLEYLQTAVRTQFRGGELSVDYLLETRSRSQVDWAAQDIGYSFLYIDSGEYFSPVSRLRVRNLPLKFRYQIRCQDGSSEKIGRRLIDLQNCSDKDNWSQAWLGQHEEFLLENEHLGFVMFYQPDFNRKWSYSTTSGSHEQSTIFGQVPKMSWSPAMKAYKVEGVQLVEFFRPTEDQQRLIVTEGEQ